MKRFFPQLALLLCAATLALSSGCATSPTASPTDQAITATTKSYDALTAAITAASSAVDSGVLKGQDARNAGKGFDAAKAGLDVSLTALRAAKAAAASASAASGVKP